MYVDGTCPDNRWYFPHKTSPSLFSLSLLVRDRVRWNEVESRPNGDVGLNSRCCGSPIPTALYTAALLPSDSVDKLASREEAAGTLSRHTASLRQACFFLNAAAAALSRGEDGIVEDRSFEELKLVEDWSLATLASEGVVDPREDFEQYLISGN